VWRTQPSVCTWLRPWVPIVTAEYDIRGLYGSLVVPYILFQQVGCGGSSSTLTSRQGTVYTVPELYCIERHNAYAVCVDDGHLSRVSRRNCAVPALRRAGRFPMHAVRACS